jgi:hypothetical protein
MSLPFHDALSEYVPRCAAADHAQGHAEQFASSRKTARCSRRPNVASTIAVHPRPTRHPRIEPDARRRVRSPLGSTGLARAPSLSAPARQVQPGVFARRRTASAPLGGAAQDGAPALIICAARKIAAEKRMGMQRPLLRVEIRKQKGDFDLCFLATAFSASMSSVTTSIWDVPRPSGKPEKTRRLTPPVRSASSTRAASPGLFGTVTYM